MYNNVYYNNGKTSCCKEVMSSLVICKMLGFSVTAQLVRCTVCVTVKNNLKKKTSYVIIVRVQYLCSLDYLSFCIGLQHNCTVYAWSRHVWVVWRANLQAEKDVQYKTPEVVSDCSMLFFIPQLWLSMSVMVAQLELSYCQTSIMWQWCLLESRYKVCYCKD